MPQFFGHIPPPIKQPVDKVTGSKGKSSDNTSRVIGDNYAPIKPSGPPSGSLKDIGDYGVREAEREGFLWKEKAAEKNDARDHKNPFANAK